MSKPMTIKQFNAKFPDDDACLDHLMKVRYGEKVDCASCGAEAKYHRVRGRRCYECEFCGYQVYPTAGTPFARTRTSLRDWFYVMFLFCSTRNGVSAKEIQRQIGVTYKTAWRMGHEIRKYMGWVDGDDQLGGSGSVETDEVFIGGKDKLGKDDKYVVLGMLERGGSVITRLVEDKTIEHVVPHIVKNVKEGSTVYTDKARIYADLKREGFVHEAVNHKAGEYVRGQAHTNSIEGFWSALKRGINGTHIAVSRKHLPSYLGEFEFRHNLRKAPHLMFDLLLVAFPRP